MARRCSRRRPEPDVALVDIGLPDGDGLELSDQLTAPPWAVRVVLVSSDSDRREGRGRRGGGRVHPQERPVGPSLAAARRGMTAMDLRRDGPLRMWSGRTTSSSVTGSAGAARRGLDVVAEAGDAGDLLALTLAHRPDVAVMDIRMPPRRDDDGLQVALESAGGCPTSGS